MKDTQPTIIWDKGSAYDLFVSLWVIHRPDEFGLRPSWAAGVRSRLPIKMREVLEQTQKFLPVPLAWIHHLPEPKDAHTALIALEALSPEERLPALFFDNKQDARTEEYQEIMRSLAGKKRLSAKIESHIRDYYRESEMVNRSVTRAAFEAWQDRETFGQAFLQALRTYVDNFFLEEEPRVIPAQDQALEKARALTEEMDVLAILEELSAGVQMDWAKEVSTLVLAPSFWGAPFVYYDSIHTDKSIILFGARPTGTTLVPGELVPDELLNSLKALADPTRLRILHYLQEGSCTPGELSKILRLRPSTVIHHLQNLRLAGLVRVTVSPQAERCYALRLDGVDEAINYLKTYISGE